MDKVGGSALQTLIKAVLQFSFASQEGTLYLEKQLEFTQ